MFTGDTSYQYPTRYAAYCIESASKPTDYLKLTYQSLLGRLGQSVSVKRLHEQDDSAPRSSDAAC
ncbi:hypothetical protein E5D57_011248 [Metarhizium anisopliae]|nr:hypothetical protein E5D57_011248 [Metarhizium anisopliae]